MFFTLLLASLVAMEVSFLAVGSVDLARSFGHGDPLSRFSGASDT